MSSFLNCIEIVQVNLNILFDDFRNAIRDMVVRGAPAIAIAAALSLAVEIANLKDFNETSGDAASFLEIKLEYLVSRFLFLHPPNGYGFMVTAAVIIWNFKQSPVCKIAKICIFLVFLRLKLIVSLCFRSVAYYMIVLYVHSSRPTAANLSE